jgi:hypothetical protein
VKRRSQQTRGFPPSQPSVASWRRIRQMDCHNTRYAAFAVRMINSSPKDTKFASDRAR